MERNTVIIDLDRYEDLMTELAGYKEELQKLRNITKDNILISKEDFYVDEVSEEENNLYIKTRALEQMVNEIGGYSLGNHGKFSEIKISNYFLTVKKES